MWWDFRPVRHTESWRRWRIGALEFVLCALHAKGAIGGRRVAFSLKKIDQGREEAAGPAKELRRLHLALDSDFGIRPEVGLLGCEVTGRHQVELPWTSNLDEQPCRKPVGTRTTKDPESSFQMETNRLYRQHDSTTDSTTCRNSGLLDSSEIKLKDDHSTQGAHFSEKKTFTKLELVRSLSRACRACGVGKCDSKDCVELKETLAKLNPRCGNWRDLEEWAVQLAACICSQKNRAYKKDPCKLPAEFTSMISLVNRYSDEYSLEYLAESFDWANGVELFDDFTSMISLVNSDEYSSEYLAENFDWANGVELFDVLGVVAWLNGITTGRYEVLQVPNELQQDRDTRQVMEAVERAKEYELCPHRVWAIAGSLPGRELNLPALIPLGMHSDKVRHAEHYRCTFDFCEYSRKDFTAQKQRHECSGRNCKHLRFPLQELEEPALAGNPTAWKLYERSIIEPTQTFMAISHVWADGTGTGPWQAGEVNECLYDFFCRIAAQFQCEGIWWDTICIPRDDKKARNEAMNNLQSNYIGARITLVHDLYLREWVWVDDESACFAIVMSTWFSRGWTSLELAKSGKVKVLFKSGTSGSLTIKDLDEDILAKPGEPSSPWRQVATAAIFNLRHQRITGVNDILTALGPRDTSWPKDMAIISGLLAGVEIPVDLSQHEINQRILRKINQVSQGHLFHNSATMIEGFSWCPNSLLDIPLALTSSTSSTLNILENGDIVGWWRVFSLEAFPSEQYIWKATHPLIRAKIQLALKNKDKHLFLVEAEAASITQALLVKIVREKGELPQWIHCQFVGPVHFIWPQTGGTEKGVMIKARIGDVKGMGELENEIAFKYVLRMATNINNQDAQERKGGGNKELGENDKPDPNAKEVIRILQEKVDDFNSRGKYAKTVLHMAAEKGYASAVRLLLDKNNNDDVNVQDSMGRTALLLAATNGNGVVVELLLKGEADPNLADNYEQTAPLHRAAWGGFKAIVEQLLNNEANPANPRASNKLRRSALHVAAERGEEDVVQVMLEKVTDANVLCTNDGQTVLHRAAWGGSIAVVRLLLEKGVDPNTEDNFGWTALHMAAEQGHMRVIHLLLTVVNGTASKRHEAVAQLVERGAQIERKNKEGWTMMHCAAHNGQEEVVRRLINMGANVDTQNLHERTPSHLAAEKGHEAIVQLLIEKKANIEVEDHTGWCTPLHLAAAEGHQAIVKLLIEKQTNLTEKERRWELTPLQVAARNGRKEIVQLLVKNGALVNRSMRVDDTPLGLAVQNGHEGIAQFLFESGADAKTALHLAAVRGHKTLVRFLLEKGVCLDSYNEDGLTPLMLAASWGKEAMVELLLEKGAEYIYTNDAGNTTLSLAASEKRSSFAEHEAVGRLLLERRRNDYEQLLLLESRRDDSEPSSFSKGNDFINWMDLKNKEGWTAMHHAAHNGHEGIVRMLIKNRANINGGARRCGPLHFRTNPLHLAAKNGHEDIVQLLVSKRAIDAQDERHWTALCYAADIGHERIVEILLQRGAYLNVKTRLFMLHANVSALHPVARNGDEGIAMLLTKWSTIETLDVQALDGTGTPLSWAVQNEHEAIVRVFLARGANPNSRDRSGGRTPLLWAVQKGNEAIVKLLLLTARRELPDCDKFLPLLWALEYGNKAIVKLLVLTRLLPGRYRQIRALPNYPDYDKRTPLWWAVQKGNEAIVKLLLESGAKLDIKDKDGCTPLSCGLEKGDQAIMALLREKGGNLEA